MRLLRFRHGDRIATGAIINGDTIQVLVGTFFEDPLPTGEEVELGDVLLLAPVLPSKVVCVGKNYAAHAAEFGGEVPDEPLLFLKPSTAVIGPNDPIRLLPISKRIDYEGELAVVIGRLARNVRAEDASRYILGFTCANDVTLRSLQRADDQWTRAKGFDGSCPLGPWIETAVDPTGVSIETRLNGDVVQRGSTEDMVFGVATLIEYITTFMTLLPGDVVLTGTPEGVGPLAARRRRRGRGRRGRHAGESGGGTVTVRCRFAPAPSGSLHVGNVRSALFSWLWARHNDGVFILRVEDTDASRVTEEAFRGVLDDLRWLGLDWDEGPEVGGPHGPYRQSERAAIYAEKVTELLANGSAYHCYCTEAELEERNEAARARGEAPGYDGRCRTLTDTEIAAYRAEGRAPVVRFRMPDTEQVVEDLVKGEVRWAPGELRDFVLARADGSPVFLLAVAVDDLLMEITHVVRGDDLLAAAPRNARVIEALGGTSPAYAHVPQVLGPDRRPLSKRHGSTSVSSFREQGFLPEALVNYLALLGWSPGDDREVLSVPELIEAFDLTRVSSNPAAFDTEKLTWLNNRYIQSLGDDDLAARCVHFLVEAGVGVEPGVLRDAMPLVKERMKTLTESVELLRFLFSDDITPNEKAAGLLAKAPEGYLKEAAVALDASAAWDATTIAATLDGLATGAGLNRTKGWQPIRAAVTGSNVSPPLPESLALLGRERTIARVRAAAG